MFNLGDRVKYIGPILETYCEEFLGCCSKPATILAYYPDEDDYTIIFDDSITCFAIDSEELKLIEEV